jgi:predicted Zn finger-like uncharacterized protein
MIVGCPACHRQYRLDDGLLRPGARLRCVRCGHLFEAKPPQAHAAPPTRTPVPPPAVATRGPGSGPAAAPRVLLADAGRPFGPVMKPILTGLGCQVREVVEGTAVFKLAVAERPDLIIVSVHLAGLSGVAICEGIKNSPHLKSIRVAIVGSDLSADLFNRDTALAYGADLFLEEGAPEELMRRALEEVLRPDEPPSGGSGDEIGDALAGLTDPQAKPPGAGEDIRRLARIMLSDLRLYNPDRFGDALQAGRLLEVFKEELARGRAIVDHRFPGVAGRQDLLLAALREGIERERFARSRN